MMGTYRYRNINMVQHQPAAEQQDDEEVVQRPSSGPSLM